MLTRNEKLVELAQDILDMEMEWQLAIKRSIEADEAKEKAIEASENAAAELSHAASNAEEARKRMKSFLNSSEE